ncbi:B-cell receptor CD22-like [Carassius auratus]|uniref:B-cell receptor CD22-like n=1 Tax=Carassius auratus TaxID=7957 RepID=A0A6P6R2N6_CARAU|nr:B-cell receptor CD22-like [Carassius auratus]
MSVRMAPRLPLIFLLMIHGVSAGWGVSYSPSHICALKNSSVIMICTYTYPTGYKIEKVFWTKNPVKGEENPDLSEDPEYSQRLQYLGDKKQNCTIRLSHVTQNDQHMYCFRFITDKPDGVWLGHPGVTLTVTDLQVEAPERVTEGDSVRLTCKSSCALTDRATLIWYRNSQPLTERRDRNNQLLLQSVRREDAGRYSCALHGHTYISPAAQLNVTYPPKSVSVSISPSVIVEGDSVTLICSSDSNPPAEISWFKGGMFVGSGRIYSISKISSDHSEEYKCKSINEHGEKYSDAVTLNIMYPPRSVSVSISPSVIMEGDSVTLICSSDSNPPAEISWFKGGMFVGSGRIYSISKISSDHSGEYKCRSINEHGEKYSDAVTLNVMYPPRSVSVSISPSGVILEGDSVTLTCSSDSNPPAEISWFKGGMIVGSGRIYSISNIRSDHSGEYKCRSINEHGEKYSDAVTLNVMYPPRNVSVSITGSGVIVEGDSVTLNCSSDSNPPAEISWFKGGTSVGSGRIYSISNIRSDHNEEYKCRSINEHGEKYSDAVTLNIMYPPRNVSVSINGSGVIVEGDSVTLICSSDSNPPAEISWFKGGIFVGSGRIYSVSKISSDHSGEYKCRSINEHGEKYSDAVNLGVMYPPRNVSVSITGSGVIVEGDSVTLICSSDSNPPALNFSWFKENQSSAVGSGQSFSALQSGRFYCEAHNQHGSQRSDAVTVTVHPGADRNVIVIAATSGGFIITIIIIIIILFIKRKRSVKTNLTITKRVSVHDESLSEPDPVNDALYASVKPSRSTGETPESRDTEEIQYAAVQYHRKKEKSRLEDECQYDNIRVHQHDAAMRQSNVQTMEDASVIYSSVK